MTQQQYPNRGAGGADRIETHYRQQLSALVDGELAPDEARFLLRRLQHDQELAGCYERWQLWGQVMRGEVREAVATDLGRRVAEAVRAEAETAAAAAAGRRRSWMRWGGGAALAASVAVVALLAGRPELAPQPGVPAASVAGRPELAPQPGVPAASVAVQAHAEPQLAAVPPGPPADAVADAAPAVAAPAPARPRPVRRAQPRVEQAVATAPVPAAPAPAQPGPEELPAGTGPVLLPVEPAAALAAQPAEQDPFASEVPPHARPWPRSTLPQAGGAYTASFGEGRGSPFYPFEPRLPQEPAAEPSALQAESPR